MRIVVKPTCFHAPEIDQYGAYHRYTNSGEPYVGTHAVISPDGVWLDGEPVILRDRRMKKNRERGHNWVCEGAPWTSFIVSVDPNEKP